MKRLIFMVALGIAYLFSSGSVEAQEEALVLAGQLSGWGLYNTENSLPYWLGIRYIPQLNFKHNITEEKLIDLEASANIFGSAGIHPFDTTLTDGSIKPYRAWVRYSTNQFELRLGLQKINFGSASLLRPLMWFDQVDPRDPLQLTDGVWGILGRYYFLNNANLWLWCLYGNKNPKSWEIAKTSSKYPEAGGRIQSPVPGGEAAISYHFRMADTREIGSGVPAYSEAAENRIGVDGKWDLGVGLWFEGVWINKNKDLAMLTNQEMLNLGTDYTFGLGNGLNVVFEHLLASYDKTAFSFSNRQSFSALSVSYPLGIVDNLSTIIYYDWINRSQYNFINWKRQFDNFSYYIIAYWNPATYSIPQQTSGTGNLFSGKGIQLMLVLNH